MLRTLVAAVAMLLLAAPAFAEDEPYLDDRSEPQTLALSSLNAINRHEYARAYQYLSPYIAPDYEAWVVTFDDVEQVTATFGELGGQGGAGDIYYGLPVTLDYTHADGQHHIAKGCISIVWQLPHDVEPPYRPMFISALLLETVDPANPEATRAECDDGRD